MVNQSLLFIILVVIIVVLMFYLSKVETFQTDEDYKRIKAEILKDLETEVLNSDSLGNLDSTELQKFFDELKVYFENRLDDSFLKNFLEIEKKCLENQELLSKISNNSS